MQKGYVSTVNELNLRFNHQDWWFVCILNYGTNRKAWLISGP